LIALFGGTFDPVHLGHLAAAEAARQALDVQEVRLVLARQPYHKSASAGASVTQRWDMLVLACKAHAHLVADDSELAGEGPSYTVDLLERRAGLDPHERRCWIIGTDAFAPILGWRRVEDVFRLTSFLVFRRAGSQAVFDEQLGAFLATRMAARLDQAVHGQVMIVEADLPDISSSRVRETIHAGENGGNDADRWLDPTVADYIRKNRLYA
jgi:nicotinate-nucleotide adenylyltransferase